MNTLPFFHVLPCFPIILHAGKSFYRSCAHSMLQNIYQASNYTTEDDLPAKSKINPADQPCVLAKEKELQDPTCISFSLAEPI